MASRKVRADALNDLQRYVAELPPCQPEEVTTREAVRMALPQIRAMQSKGYNLDAIAKVFSEIGIEVTAVALKRYVQLAETERPRGARKPMRSNGAAGATSAATADPTRQNGTESGVTALTAGTARPPEKEPRHAPQARSPRRRRRRLCPRLPDVRR
jgi:hypothetical protein